MELTSNFLVKAGIHQDRLKLDWVSAAEGERFANIVTGFTQQVKSLGPMGEAEGLDKEELNERLSAVQNALSGEKLRWLVGRELKLLEEGNVYDEKVEQDEILELIQENMDKEYVRNRMLLMMKKEPLSVKDVAGRWEACPADILRHIVAMENAGTVSMADVQGRSPRYIANE
jgi:F420-non-reducing hydrogenase iron-sulfur subunit